jgi:tripartite ATP-independent transporter DctP family solute receptor
MEVKLMKKLLSLLLISLLAMSLVACGGKDDKKTDDTSKETKAQDEAKETEAPAGDVIKVQIGFENAMYEPIGKALEKWQELLAEQSNGTMEIVLYPDSQLGSKNELIDSMLLGEPVITLADGAFYADYGVKDFGILFGPFLFDNWEQCWTLIESDWYKEQSGLLEEKGLKLVASNWVYGERHTMTNSPVETVEDLAGMKIRVPSNQIQTEGFNVLGATAVGMPLGDAYEALSTGTIEGVENPIATLYGRKFQEVSKHLILDGHVKNFTTWVTGTMFFDSLTEEQQELLISTGEEAGIYNNQLVEEAEQGYLEEMIAEGVNVVEPSEEVLAGFKEKALPFYEMEETFGWTEGLYDIVREAMGAN